MKNALTRVFALSFILTTAAGAGALKVAQTHDLGIYFEAGVMAEDGRYAFLAGPRYDGDIYVFSAELKTGFPYLRSVRSFAGPTGVSMAVAGEHLFMGTTWGDLYHLDYSQLFDRTPQLIFVAPWPTRVAAIDVSTADVKAVYFSQARIAVNKSFVYVSQTKNGDIVHEIAIKEYEGVYTVPKVFDASLEPGHTAVYNRDTTEWVTAIPNPFGALKLYADDAYVAVLSPSAITLYPPVLSPVLDTIPVAGATCVKRIEHLLFISTEAGAMHIYNLSSYPAQEVARLDLGDLQIRGFDAVKTKGEVTVFAWTNTTKLFVLTYDR